MNILKDKKLIEWLEKRILEVKEDNLHATIIKEVLKEVIEEIYFQNANRLKTLAKEIFRKNSSCHIKVTDPSIGDRTMNEKEFLSAIEEFVKAKIKG
jgi:hypothetical protein